MGHAMYVLKPNAAGWYDSGDMTTSKLKRTAMASRFWPRTEWFKKRRLIEIGMLTLLAAIFCLSSPIFIPAKTIAETIVSDHFPGDHILQLDERNADARAYLSQHFKHSDPSIVHEDFNGDGRADYAILLKSNTSGRAKLVVLLCDAPTRCHGVYELEVTGYSDGAYLSRLAVGSIISETEAIDTQNQSSRLKLTSSGITLTYFEKGSVALYWDEKRKKILNVDTAD